MYVGVSSVPTILIRRLSDAGNLRELVAAVRAMTVTLVFNKAFWERAV